MRYFLIDGIRGLAIVNMVAFHFFYDVFIVYGKNPDWYGMPATRIWQQMICWTFIVISGFVWQWGMQGNFWRGMRLNLYGLVISLVTLAVMPSETIWFGILNFIGCAILLMFPLEKAAKKIPPVWGMAASFALFILCRQIPHGFLGIGNLVQIQLPKVLYSIKVLTPFGFPYPDFYSSDYFPILPWMFLFLCGFFLNRIFMGHISWRRAACRKIKFLSALGSKAIWIYLVHQPVIMVVCMMLFE